MSNSEIKISAFDGTGEFSAYIAEPEGADGPGLVVLQEVFGVNQNMRDVADGFAKMGYRVCVPDLFWRIEPGVQLDSASEEGREKAMELFGKFQPATGLQDSMAALAFMKERCEKVGVVGYCMGGRLAYHMATASDADCLVGYYGVGIETVLDQAPNIKNPLMLHIPAEDHLCQPEAQAKINEALGDNPLVDLHTYAGAGHAFARVGGQGYVESAAKLANVRSAEFFSRNLR
ncbi:dienelactone hydrolase family protein [Pseudomaricurvus alkylphenolicus]|uniref:dienelactone hydrolase family protein n=1 Tax=Pseudomaricurvus alkylphenolicus TaxID=1306991 RepID=UPI001422611D|nr:dienelactone hydrolase family protein [Pseudomaricurvus alkylphenolicus]NIB38362.1 dienelactone hydrolase family protein [Pseudomaricurvus alkylphenolicus]